LKRTMRVCRKTPREFREMPWKNGLGVTREMYIFPEAALLERNDFLWRLSSAVVSAGGPFSAFPGYDRILFLLSGDGMDLQVNGEELVLADPLSSISFRGEDTVVCALRGGTVTDFNIFFRRDRVSCGCRRIIPRPEEYMSIPEGDWNIILCLRGKAALELPGREEELKEMEFLLFEESPPDFQFFCRSEDNAELIGITLKRK
jgi:environmental stress-induced protein Ves